MDKQFLPSSGKQCITVAKSTVLELHEPEKGTHLCVELLVQEGAQVVYRTGFVEELSLRVVLHNGARFTQTFLSKKAEKRFQQFELLGTRAHVEVTGAYVLKKAAKGAFDVLQHHAGKQATSNVTIKTVLDDTAHFTYHGNIKIEKTAPGTKAHQENKNLVINNGAKAVSVPSLEALNNDVQCGHGTAVSYINQEHLFYLASRGIELAQAKKMIINGFILHHPSED